MTYMRFKIIAFLFLLATITFTISSHAQELIIDRDTVSLYSGIEKALGGAVAEEKPQVITLPSGRTITTAGEPTFRIVKVTNISGNNPFNQVQPVFNLGGVQVATVSDLIDCMQSGKCTSTSTGGSGGGGSGGGGDSGACCIVDKKNVIYSTYKVPASDFFYYNVLQFYTSGTKPDDSLLKKCDWVPIGISIGETSTVKNEPVGLFVTTDPLFTPWPAYAYVGTNQKYFEIVQPPAGGVNVTKNGMNVYRLDWGTNSITIQDKKTKQKFRIPFTITPWYEIKEKKEVLAWQTLTITQVFCLP